MRAHHFLILVVLAGAYGCGSTDDDPPGTTEEPPLLPAPPEGGQQLATGTYRLQPGEEVYMCYQFYSPDDAVGITRVDAINMPGVHHLGLFTAFGRDEPVEPHECNVLVKQTWLPIWGIGASPESLIMPDNVGYVVQPGTQYIVQLHLQNSTEEVMDIRAGVNLTYERDTAKLAPAGMYAFGTFQMEIPPHSTDYQVPITNCQTGKDMNVFAVFPHMHKLGKKLAVTRQKAGGPVESFYEISPWEFGEQPIDRMTTTVKPDDTFTLTCHYDNPTGSPVPHGESTDQEMCFFVLFYYPFDGLDGCVIGS